MHQETTVPLKCKNGKTYDVPLATIRLWPNLTQLLTKFHLSMENLVQAGELYEKVVIFGLDQMDDHTWRSTVPNYSSPDPAQLIVVWGHVSHLILDHKETPLAAKQAMYIALQSMQTFQNLEGRT